MEIEGKIDTLANKVEQQHMLIGTEEATKTAFILPFIRNVLGYDVFDPLEVVPEFTADVGIKKGEKVDYAIVKNGEVQILMECKKIGDTLDLNKASQLYRYFGVTTARVAVLTNGQVYQFYTDLDAPNKMDEKPFLVLDLLNVDDNIITELKKLTKSAFDLESVMNAAGELKYVSFLKMAIAEQFKSPCEDYSKLLICKAYDGVITQKVREQFAPLIIKAMRQFLNDRVNDRLKTAITSSVVKDVAINEDACIDNNDSLNEIKDEVLTTQEEIDGFNIVRAILRSEVAVNRITARDTLSYFGVLLDDNNRKPICRLHFNRKQRYIEIFDQNKVGVRHSIEVLEDIFNYSEQLKETSRFYN